MKNYWYLALSLSFLLHITIITELPQRIKDSFSRKERIVKTEQPKEIKKTKEIKIYPKQIEKISKKPVLNPGNLKPLPYINNTINDLIQSDNFSSLQKPQIFEKNIKEIVFKKIVTPTDKVLQKNPVYMKYYRLIREKIKNNAYRNYKSQNKGEILLSFLIDKDGSLEKVDLTPKTTKNSDLRKIALKSIRESAPFPKFPDELQKYANLQFNIYIHFKNN